jgi:hypothetical protein
MMEEYHEEYGLAPPKWPKRKKELSGYFGGMHVFSLELVLFRVQPIEGSLAEPHLIG